MNPHDAIAPSLTFLRDYYTQVDRLLSDVTRHLAKADPAWQRLRRAGDSYESDCEVKIGRPEGFLVRDLGHWYAPAAAFPGHSSYGAKPSATPRLAFAGVWLGDADNPPELYAGWLEGMTWTSGKVVETHLKTLRGWLEPYGCTPEHEVTPLEAARFEARPFEGDDSGLRLAMGRVPLSEITGPEALEDFMVRWLEALGNA